MSGSRPGSWAVHADQEKLRESRFDNRLATEKDWSKSIPDIVAQEKLRESLSEISVAVEVAFQNTLCKLVTRQFVIFEPPVCKMAQPNRLRRKGLALSTH